MKKTIVTFALGMLAGAVAGVALAAWLTDQDMNKLQEKLSDKTGQLRDELTERIEALKEELKKKRA